MLKRRIPVWREGAVSILLLCFLLAAPPLWAQSAHTIGKVEALNGRVTAMSHGRAEPRRLKAGSPLFEGDQIRTGRKASVQLLLEDGSLIQLGAASDLTLDWVLYAPALDSRNVLLSMSVGIVRLIVEEVVPRSAFELRTRTAVTSVRGTDWITEAEPGNTAVIALDGAVAVMNLRPDVIGEVTLQPGEGTSVKPREPPAESSRWEEERKQAFIKRTTVP